MGVQFGMEGEELCGFLFDDFGFFVLFYVCVKQEEKFFVESMGIGGLKKVEKFKIVMIIEGVDG